GERDVVASYDYLPYGEEAESRYNPLQFTGHERDSHLAGGADDLDYMHARYYSPYLSRFTSVDPVLGKLAMPQSWNRYGYVGGNPINSVDSKGLFAESPWDAFNIGLGLTSLVANVSTGNFWGAALDGAGLVVDMAAAATPGIPGGAGTAIKASRAADTVADVARGAGKVPRRGGPKTLLHGTDVGSADDIVAHGINKEAAASLGGGDVLWMTESREVARIFAQVNPAAGKPAIVGVDLPASIVDSLVDRGVMRFDKRTSAWQVLDWDGFNDVASFVKVE
ncbi:MAG: hypothetical protein GY722_26230, partial [bacterium]|nr:hypothetical protein [bacterium]